MCKIAILVSFLVFPPLPSFVFGSDAEAIRVKQMDGVTIRRLIDHGFMSDQKTLVKREDIRPDEQSFEVYKDSFKFYMVSVNRKSQNFNSTTCSILLVDKKGKIVTSIDTVGPDHKDRYWACDYVEAVSFKDCYSDGTLKIIVLYSATPPSNERFSLPVVLKLDVGIPSLAVDEALTHRLEDADLTTIEEVRRYIKNLDS